MSVQLLIAQQPLDTIYTRIGLGPFQFLSLFFVGCAFVTESMLNVFSIVIAHAVQKEWNLSDTQVDVLSVARDVGVVITGLTCPWVGDKYGRLPAIKWGLLGTFSGVMLGVVSLSFPWLLAGFFSMGLSLGFQRPALSSFSIEILQPRARGAVLIGVLIFIGSGAIGSAAMAIYLVPMLKPTHWRALVFLAAVPTLLSLLAANFLFIKSPRYLAMTGEHEKAIKKFNLIARFNRQPMLSQAEANLVRAQPVRPSYSLKESITRILNSRYKPRLMYLVLLWFITGYQYTALITSVPKNLEAYLHNPLMAIEIAILPTAIFVPLPIVEMPHIGRRYSLLIFSVIQVLCSFLTSLLSTDLVFVASLLVLLISVTFSNRILFPFTLELFETSIRCLGFGLCYAMFRFGGLLSRWEYMAVHNSALPVMLFMNFIGTMAIFHYPYETAQKPLEDYTK